MSTPLIAGGNIPPSRFVTLSTTLNRTVLLSATGEKPIGISQTGTHMAPLLNLDDGYAAVAGENVAVYTKDDEDAWLELGTGGCTPGQFLKPDASSTGKGIAASTGDFYGARALVNGAAGEIVKVQPAFGTL